MMIHRAWDRGKCRIIYAAVAVAVYVPFILVVESHR